MVIPKVLKTWDFLFFVLLAGIAFLYSYQTILFMRPYALHQWRQSDSLSITLNYYMEGMHFFHPSVNCCGLSGNGMTCPTECPLIYYTIALLWKIFGYHEFIFRLVDTIIAFTGLYALFRLINELIQDGAWALIVSLLVFASPVFAVYANNFIPDVPALSGAFIAWYFFVKYYKTKHLLFFNISVLFFLLAGLVKITALLSFVPLIFIFLWEILGKKKDPSQKIFINPFKQGISILILIVIVSSWVAYSAYYRNLHNFIFFSTLTRPIWVIDKDSVHYILNKFYTFLLPQFFSKSFIFFILILLLYMLINFRKMNLFYYGFLVMVFLGSILYVLLWFDHMDVHDYYLVNIIIFIPITLASFLVFLKERYQALFKSNLLKILFALLLGWNIYYCAIETNIRYSAKNTLVTHTFILSQPDIDFWNWYHWDYGIHLKALETITPYLRSLGISREDKVVSIPDESPDITLYLMDQKGFTGFDFDEFRKEARIKEFKRLGAKYLILSDPSWADKDWLKPFLKSPIGSVENVTIYDLRTL